MEANKKAIELINDCLQIQLSNIDLSSQYEMAKIQAEYCANTAKWSHEIDSKKFNYWQDVKQEIVKL